MLFICYNINGIIWVINKIQFAFAFLKHVLLKVENMKNTNEWVEQAPPTGTWSHSSHPRSLWICTLSLSRRRPDSQGDLLRPAVASRHQLSHGNSGAGRKWSNFNVSANHKYVASHRFWAKYTFDINISRNVYQCLSVYVWMNCSLCFWCFCVLGE